MRLSKLNLTRTAFLLLLVVTLILVALKPDPVAASVLGITVLLSFFLVRWHARTTVYTCPDCGHSFKISSWTDFVSPHTGDKKWLACPSCSKEVWCKMA